MVRSRAVRPDDDEDRTPDGGGEAVDGRPLPLRSSGRDVDRLPGARLRQHVDEPGRLLQPGPLLYGTCKTYLTDNLTKEKIVVYLELSQPDVGLDFDLDLPCFGQPQCEPPG